MKRTLDRYSLLIISKYFNTCDDFINSMLTNKKFGYLVDMFHYNPILINYKSKKLFTNIETQHIYSRYDEIIPNLFKYIVWYPSGTKTIEYFDKKYHIRPIFKKLYVDYSFVSSGNKKEGDLLILTRFQEQKKPIEVDCSEFIGIEQSSFRFHDVSGVKLGKQINSISSYSFQHCSLESIDLSFLTELRDCFVWCTNLTSITISKHLEIMDINCFMGCPSLKSITITGNSKEFKLDLSYELYKIMKSNGITCTGNVWITNDEEITTDIGCKIIKTKEFFNQEIVKLDSLQLIPSSFIPFCCLDNIKKIILSPNVVSIVSQSFKKMKSLESINLENVKNIEYRCFLNCIKLKEVNISNTRTLGKEVFCGCSNLRSVTYSTYLNYILRNCFLNCSKLKEIKGIENVNQICSNCFKNCNNLEFDKLPNNLIQIGNLNGSKFKIKSIDKDCPIIRFEGECFIGNTTLEYIHITEEKLITCLERNTFSFCTSLKEVKLEGIKMIGDSCFRDCYSLSTIELPSTLKTIGRYCFENCWSLKEVQFPSSVKYIGKDALLSCKSLSKILFGNGKVKISFDIFKHCPLKEINLINGNKMKGYFSYEHYLMLKLKGIDVKKVEYTRSDRRKYGNIIPECCCRIGEKAFEGCSMKELTIPSNIKSLGYKCFNNCRILNKIYMSSELKNGVTVEMNPIFGNVGNGGIFTVSVYFQKNNYNKVLYERKQKDQTISIEVIKI